MTTVHRLSPLLAALTMAGAAQAQQQPVQRLETVLSQGRASLGKADSASEGELGAERLVLRPLLRPAELLEAMPGMTVTQHSGDGKANQYFLRGFNLDHGSDFATTVLGMPVNLPSHAHGQGYMDLNFLIPELVDSLRYRKGAFDAEDGDFATTGAARIGYARTLERSFAQLNIGPHGYRRALAAGSTTLAGWSLLGAAEGSRYDGPWEQPENIRRNNLVLRLARGDDRNGLDLNLLSYRGDWLATDHVPERAITGGEIGRFGALQAGDGGYTHRRSVSAGWAHNQGDSGQWRGHLWAIDYQLNLFSNFSGFITGPDGDQMEQSEHRRIYGGDLRHELPARWLPAGQQLVWGLQVRQDRIGSVGLYQTVERQRVNTVREDRVNQTSLGGFAQLESQWTPGLRSVAGLRWDSLRARITPTGGPFNMDNGGRASQSQLSPKLGLIAKAGADTEVYAHWARAFRSNDVRGATTTVNPADGSDNERLPLLARTTSTELGLRTKLAPGWTSSLAVWRANLASELVFVGDAGVTEARDGSRRIGVEWSNDVQIGRDWLIDADIAWSRARFVQPVDTEFGPGREVPNAVPVSASMSINWQPGGAWSSGVKLRYLGAYALEESGSRKSKAAFTANWRLNYQIDTRWQLGLDVLNLFNAKVNDIEYWGASCTRAEGPGCGGGGEGINGRLVHPMEPRAVRVSLRGSF